MSSSKRGSRDASGREVGRLVGLWRYPVKSMAGESLQESFVSWHGLAGDRRWAFIRPGQMRSGFPWLTIREQPRMLHYRPRLSEPDDPAKSATRVSTPSGAELEVLDPALAAELGDGVRVIKQNTGVFDTFPISLITTQTVGALGARLERELDVGRFRPNLLVAANGEAPFPEDSWVGSILSIGGARLRIDKRDQRCVVVNVDPITTEREPSVLRTIAKERDARLGVYGSTVSPGRVAIGDAVIVN